MEDYLDLFDLEAHKIQESLSGNSGDHHALQLITGEHLRKRLSVCECVCVCLCARWMEKDGKMVSFYIFCGKK